MKTSINGKVLSAFKKLGVVALITATLAVFFTACKQTGKGDGSGSGDGGGNGGGTTESEAPFVEGGVSLILEPDISVISIRAETSDGNPIVVEGCAETSLPNDKRERLHPKGNTVILKGKIIYLSCGSTWLNAINVQGLSTLQELYCEYNKLTSLNIQGLTALKRLDFSANPLNDKALIKIFNALPNRTKDDKAWCRVYSERSDKYKDFNNPPTLKAAFDGAKNRNWTLKKVDANGNDVDI